MDTQRITAIGEWVPADVTLPEPAGEGKRVGVFFARMKDGSWASDAIVAVRRGRTGRKVYAEGIHLPPSPYLPGEIHVTARNIRPLFGLEPVIVGWVRDVFGRNLGPYYPVGVEVTADPALCDYNWVKTRPSPLPFEGTIRRTRGLFIRLFGDM